MVADSTCRSHRALQDVHSTASPWDVDSLPKDEGAEGITGYPDNVGVLGGITKALQSCEPRAESLRIGTALPDPARRAVSVTRH